ncbi:MAG: hypothetical protein WB947_00070 [Thermoplasmata archaeon]
MTADSDRRLAFIFGALGAVLLVIAAIVRFFLGVVFVATGHGYLGIGSIGESVIFLVVGLVIGFFALIGRSRGTDRSLAVGVILVVLAIVGWVALGFGSSLLALLGAVFTLISGIIFLVAGR